MNLHVRKSFVVLVAMLAGSAGSALAAPVIASITPSSGSTVGGVMLTISGASFSASGNTATIDGHACQVTAESTNLIFCTIPEGTGATNDVQVLDGLGVASNTRNYSYNAPSLTMVSPASGPSDGGTVITLTGNDFGPASADALRSVSLGSASCALVPAGGSHTQVTCTTPEGQGTGHDVAITVDGQPSGTASFSYSPPSILSLDPVSGPAAGGTRLTISGSSFGTLANVTVDGNDCPVDVQSHSSIECTVPAGSGADAPVVVAVSGQVSAPALYDYVSPPAISLVFPSSGPTAGGISITISGSNFSAVGNSATVGGSACAVGLEGPSLIVCSLPEGTGLDKEVEVTSAGQHSNIALFDYAAPVITSVDPSHGPTQGSVPITINGNNFGPIGADAVRSVTVGTSDCPLLPSSSNHSVITCTLPEGQGLGRTVDVDVDGQPSNTATLDYDAPLVGSVTPASVPAAGNVPITVVGSNFGLEATVTVGGNDCPVTLQSHDELRCTLPPGTGNDVALLVSVSGQEAMSTIDYVPAVCGDGSVDPDEDCDDTNSADLDGCSAACETEQIQDKDQAGCIVGINKAAAGVMKAQGKDVAACARDAQSGVACIGVTNSAPLDKAVAKIALINARNCANFDPGLFQLGSEAEIEAANTGEEVELARDMFGADPDAALAPDALAPGRAACQQDVLEATNKLVVARLKAFGKCKKAGFKDEVIRAPSQLAGCLDEIDNDPAVAKPTAAQFQALIDSCVNLSEDLAAAFPGVCSSAPSVGDCLETRVRCRTCRALVATDGLDDDCDGHDDGIANASCP